MPLYIGSATTTAVLTNDTQNLYTSYSTTGVLSANGTKTVMSIPLVIGLTAAILIVLAAIVTLIIALVLIWRRFGRHKLKNVDTDGSYSKCQKGNQQIQPQSLTTSTGIYNQIQPSPLTGQVEFIATKNVNKRSIQNAHKSYPGVDKGLLKLTSQPPYADTKKKNGNKTWVRENESKQMDASAENDSHIASSKTVIKQRNRSTQKTDAHEGTYAVVHKKQKTGKTNANKTSISSPSCTGVEELYTAVKKKPKIRATKNEEEAPPVPPHTMEQLYTAVKKKPKDNMAHDEAAPPIPAHAVKQLYTAVRKKPKDRKMRDEAAPPIPPHTGEELYTAVQKTQH